MTQMLDLDDLISREKIREVLYVYCRGVDRGDVELIKSCYHDDSFDDHGMYAGNGHAFAEWIVQLPQVVAAKAMAHKLSNVLIELDGDSASVESYGTSSRDDGDWVHITDFRNIDKFERRDGIWKILSRTVVTEAIARVARLPESSGEKSLSIQRGRRDKGDLSYTLGFGWDSQSGG